MTPEQQAALAAVRQRMAAQQAPQAAPQGPSPTPPITGAPEGSQPFQRAGGYGPFMAGVAEAGIKGYMGLKQLIPGVGLSDQDKAVLQQIKEESEADPNGGMRTAGSIAGNVAATAVPGNAIARGAQGLKILANTGRALPYLANAAAAGGTEVLTAVGQGDTQGEQVASKLKQAGTAAVAAPVLQRALKAVASPVTGMFNATPEAKQLIAQGINPTLQQGAAGGMGRFVGGLTSGALDTKGRLRDEVAQSVMNRASGGMQSMPGATGGEVAGGVQDQIRNEYSQLFDGKMVNISPKLRSDLAAVVRNQLPPDQSGALANSEAQRIVANRFPGYRRNMPMTYDAARSTYRDPLNADMFVPNITDEVRDVLRPVRDRLDQSLHAGLSPDEMAQLQALNVRNFDVERLQDAVKGVEVAKEGVDINRLAAAYAKMLPQARSMGNTTFDDIVAPAARLFNSTPTQDASRSLVSAGKKIGLPAAALLGTGAVGGAGAATGLAVAASPLVGLSLIGQTGRGAKGLFGQYDMQKKATQAMSDADTYARPSRDGTAAQLAQKLGRGAGAVDTTTAATISALRRINKLRALERGVVINETEEE